METGQSLEDSGPGYTLDVEALPTIKKFKKHDYILNLVTIGIVMEYSWWSIFSQLRSFLCESMY